MLIIISSDGNDLQSSVSKRFGHAAYFIEYDTDSKQFKVEKNIREGYNHDNLFGYLNKGVEAFLVGNIGPHAFGIANTFQSNVYLARKMTVQRAIDHFLKGELEHLTRPTGPKSIRHSREYKNGIHQERR